MLKRGDKKEMKQSFTHSHFFPKNTKGQELSTNVIILIILGVVVLVVLILGFTVGWGKIAPWLSSENVGSIVTQCEVACSTGSDYDYCIAKKDLNAQDEKLKDVTCYYVAENQTIYGVAKCPSITCTDVILSNAVDEASAKTLCTSTGKMIYYLQDKTLKFYSCPEV